MPNQHYENFPVASPLLPAHLRAPVRVIYAFARSADDLADEGDAAPDMRLAALKAYSAELQRIDANQAPETALFQQLADTLQHHGLGTQPLHDLLSAFSQDVVQTRYPTYEDLLDYCTHSANPVGRIMLGLFKEDQPPHLERSDAICSALQIINFLQDVAIDWDKARVYLPQEDLRRFGVSEQQIAHAEVDARWRELMAFEVKRARQLMRSGAPLALDMPGRFGWELRLIVLGGLRIWKKLKPLGSTYFGIGPPSTSVTGC
jgi:squalene synthase HpnC